VTQSVGHHRIFPVDEGRQAVVLPKQISSVALLGRLEHEAQPGVVAFVLEAADPPAPAAKAHAPGLPQTDAVEGAIGSACQRLRQHRIHMVSNPATVQALGGVVQRVFGKPVALPERPEGSLAPLLLAAGNGTCRLPGGIGAHAPESPLPFRQDRVIEVPCRFQMRAEALRLAGGDVQGHLQEKSGRPFALLRCLLVRCLFPAHGG
jgi:hypothetical protein